MKRSTLQKALCSSALLLMISFAPGSLFAQRGGHAGGGFHGGGGGGGFHGGGGGYHGGYGGGGYARGVSYAGGYHGGGYHGGNYGGWHGGYYGGWRGGHWGYPYYGYGWGGWGWGWGIGVSFGWGWPSYPYAYGYAPYYPYNPYSYPYYYYATPASYVSGDPATSYGTPNAPAGYVTPEVSPENQNNGGNYQDNLPPAQSSAPVPRSVPNSNSYKLQYASYAAQRLPAARPEVQNAIRALRAMPPYAREQQLSRYGNLTPTEVALVRQAVGMQPVQ
jgi:hypothetical protein